MARTDEQVGYGDNAHMIMTINPTGAGRVRRTLSLEMLFGRPEPTTGTQNLSVRVFEQPSLRPSRVPVLAWYSHIIFYHYHRLLLYRRLSERLQDTVA